MIGKNMNFGSSVLKRESKDIEVVEDHFINSGWNKTGSALNGRLRYFEKSGINITALDGPSATLIMPSGPVRGAIFGDESVGFSRVSVIGASKNEDTERVRTEQRSRQYV